MNKHHHEYLNEARADAEDVLDRIDQAYDEGLKPIGFCKTCDEPTERLNDEGECPVCEDEPKGTDR